LVERDRLDLAVSFAQTRATVALVTAISRFAETSIAVAVAVAATVAITVVPFPLAPRVAIAASAAVSVPLTTTAPVSISPAAVPVPITLTGIPVTNRESADLSDIRHTIEKDGDREDDNGVTCDQSDTRRASKHWRPRLEKLRPA
jgi:hypothetical protein